MPTYDDVEISQTDSEPVEGYEFIGAASTWRYTSGVAVVTIAGHAYAPLAGLIRGRLEQKSLSDTPTLVVQVPNDAQVVAHYGFQTPPRSLRLKVYRYQPAADDHIIEWDGDVTSLVPRESTAEMRVPSRLGTKLATTVPSLTVRRHCVHALYDDRCRVARGDFDHATTVNAVSGADPRIITVSDIGGKPDQWFRAGEVVRDADGERRSIVDQVGAVIKVIAPFRTLANGNDVTMYKGCDHSLEMCRDDFDNELNFGGFVDIPRRNPWRLALRLGAG